MHPEWQPGSPRLDQSDNDIQHNSRKFFCGRNFSTECAARVPRVVDRITAHNMTEERPSDASFDPREVLTDAASSEIPRQLISPEASIGSPLAPAHDSRIYLRLSLRRALVDCPPMRLHRHDNHQPHRVAQGAHQQRIAHGTVSHLQRLLDSNKVLVPPVQPAYMTPNVWLLSCPRKSRISKWVITKPATMVAADTRHSSIVLTPSFFSSEKLNFSDIRNSIIGIIKSRSILWLREPTR